MTKYEADDPVLLDVFTTDSKGRLNLGGRFADKKLKVLVVEEVEE